MEYEIYGAENKKDFHKAFFQMANIVENLFVDCQRRLEKNIRKHMSAAGDTSEKNVNGVEPPKTPPYPSPSSSSASYSITSSNATKKHVENLIWIHQY